jgi:hypothetical protein
MRMKTAMALAAVLVAASTASAGILQLEDFSAPASWDNGGTPNANTPVAYQHLVWDSPNVNDTNGTASGGIAGVLMMHTFGGGQARVTTAGGFAGDITASIDITSTGVNCGLVLGDLYVLFHPGNATGALRVSRISNNSLLIGNQNVGFSPSSGGSLHHLEVAVDTTAEELDITLIDGDNAANVYVLSNLSYATGDYVAGSSLIGWRRVTSGQAWYDNFTVEAEDPPVAEPAGLGLIGLALISRRRRA